MPSTHEHPTMESTPTRSFVRTGLPWAVAGAMLLVYLLTLNRVITFQSLWPLARASGLDWHGVYTAPLTYLLTLPVRWLPGGVQLFALNLISALCAAASLGLLARCVAILPHDRTQLQRDKQSDEFAFLNIKLAWVPVLFAVLAAGLQLSFWEHAIVGTGEMIDLVIFAYCVRCVLEYRLEEKNSWLYRMAVVYGVGITNNYAMIGFLPVLLISLVWIKGWRFFRFDFLVKMFLFALAGLSLYLLLPLFRTDDVSFWHALKTNLVHQKQMVVGLRRAAILPAVYCLIPLLLMGIRWPSSFGDQSAIGSLFANIAALVLHLGLLVFCIYMLFDPPVSPRRIAAPYRDSYGIQFVFLPVYFLGALIIGYYSAFLMLVFSGGRRERGRKHFIVPPIVGTAIAVLVCAALVLVAGRLVQLNFPVIRKANSDALNDYAAQLVAALPNRPSVVLSDTSQELHALGVALQRRGKHDHVLLDTTALSQPAYQRFLNERYGAKFPKLPASRDFGPSQILGVLSEVAARQPLVYLQPSFGYFFEVFTREPFNLLYTLQQATNAPREFPKLSDAAIARQQAYWAGLRGGVLKEIKAEVAAIPADERGRNLSAAPLVGVYYSRALNTWGVELQRVNRLDEALAAFNEAIELNPDNAAALINRAANQHYRKEKTRLPQLGKLEQEKLGMYRGGLTELLGTCGPVDEASFLEEFGHTFAQRAHYRQAEQMLRRAVELSDDFNTRLGLASVLVQAGESKVALNLLDEVRRSLGWPAAVEAYKVEAARVEALAQLNENNFAAAEQVLKRAVQQHPRVDLGHYALSQLYAAESERYRGAGSNQQASLQITNALRVIQNLISMQPTNASAYFTYGNLAVYAEDFTAGAEAFSKVLQLTGKNKAALFNRAVCYLRGGRLADARRDYVQYLKDYTPDYRVYFGLGEIAMQENNARMAREHFQEYLRLAPPEIEERKTVLAKLEELKKRQ